MGAGKLCRCDDALDRQCWIGQSDIVANRPIEQHVLLQDDADLPSQPGGIDHGEIDAVDEDAAAFRHVKSLDQLGQRALARSRRSDNADASGRAPL